MRICSTGGATAKHAQYAAAAEKAPLAEVKPTSPG
jgi:hypothetical protein